MTMSECNLIVQPAKIAGNVAFGQRSSSSDIRTSLSPIPLYCLYRLPQQSRAHRRPIQIDAPSPHLACNARV